MISRILKKESFETVARWYWEKRVCGLLVPGKRGCAPSEGEVLCAYNEMKSHYPGCKCNVVRSGKSQGDAFQRDMFQQGDKICGIRIVTDLNAANSSIEFILADSLYYVHFKTDGIDSFSHRVDTCDLLQTIKNIKNFIDNFPAHLTALENEKVEFEKKAKLKEISRLSLKTCVAQMMSQLSHEWNLADKGKYFLLQIELGKKRMIEISLNDKNFTKRIPAIPNVLKSVEGLLETMPFPVDISMTKGILKL
ncbi:hypothetical protein FSU_1615 [Fibrobacter succinogenes subsp. succinogenes S85]|uniref:Uncharacterized protein n=1 Tax=Fibrobacter succinogenes (strain ATCC 19169 / S85) TaxID=59374 RepID=C9RQ83_FIBSS|nr:hypothetical protein [Fibrobacter succinogenes]ACX74760.1 hypothetical protein Fisuc_1156 [Fibrobacter succinogenes subsp. succinogenes S85]ADL25966.1 hypothetical protein FSU_1615 [Fibrobacter succinogenes subsp. succinogenes S85]